MTTVIGLVLIARGFCNLLIREGKHEEAFIVDLVMCGLLLFYVAATI